MAHLRHRAVRPQPVRQQSEVCPAGAEAMENKAKGKLSATSKDKLPKTGLDSHSGDQELMGRVNHSSKRHI